MKHHTVNALACYKLRYEQLSGTSPNGPLTEQCQQLRECLHNRDRRSVDVFDDICEQYSKRIEPAMTCSDGSEVGTIFATYTQQVEHHPGMQTRRLGRVFGSSRQADQIILCTRFIQLRTTNAIAFGTDE